MCSSDLEHPDTLGSVNNLGYLLRSKGDYDGAEALYRRALEGQEKALGPDHPATMISVNDLAVLLAEKGDYAGAEPLYRRVLEGEEKVLGPEHPDTLNIINYLATLLYALGRLTEALELLRKKASVSKVAKAAVRYNLACYECLSGNLDEAKRLITEEIAANPEKKEQVLQDEDLKPIWDFIKLL